MELSPDLTQEIQQAWHRFLQRTEPLRPDLHRYCRALTGAVWDAEDLVQDTLLRAFAKLGEMGDKIDNPKAYLFRIASNLWVDHFRTALVGVPPSSFSQRRIADTRLFLDEPKDHETQYEASEVGTERSDKSQWMGLGQGWTEDHPGRMQIATGGDKAHHPEDPGGGTVSPN
ncbi:MAG: RNA polymerase sigma factor [Deltaproteobacteria bacterium]|nr:RNA polymerase sigma factor [Deltaproteobacteria bacterium]